METLFSFELLVDNILIDVKTKVSEELAVALRLLDFPTLIIYQPEHKQMKEGEYSFNRGKACFFKMNIDSLHSHLSNTPLYAMVLDVKEEVPTFVGSSLISLSKVMDKIRQDVTERGVSAPSSHGQRGIVSISNLTGEKVGTISLSFKLLSLGSNVVSQIKDTKNTGIQCLNDTINKKKTDELPINVHTSITDQHGVSRHPLISKQETFPSSFPVSNNSYEEDMSVFCPPELYYNNSAEERQKYEEENRKLLKLNLEAFTVEGTKDEGDKNVHSAVKELRSNAKTSSQEKHPVSSEVTPNVISEALRQISLLSALVELSQLNAPNTNRSISVDPNLAWIDWPASTEPLEGQKNTPRKSQNESLQENSPKLKDMHFPRHCSTPVQKETDKKSTPRKKLVYGTTKTFNLGLKQNAATGGKYRECVDLIQSKTQLNASKEKLKSTKKVTNLAERKSTQSSHLTENIETMIQSITVMSTPRESISEKQKYVDVSKPIGMLHEDRASPSIAKKPLLIESPLRHAHIPANVESEKINQSHSDSHSGKHSGSSSRSSPDSSVSVHSREENGKVDDYADDFTSFEPSDAFSPDPMSSPESHSRAKTPNSPAAGLELRQSSDSSFGSVQKSRAVIPVPVQASRSPQRAIRGTYTIQRQTYASGVSFSSEDGDRDVVTSGLTDHSQKQGSSRSSGESFRSSGGHKLNTKREISDESSFEQKAEDNELGTLDFRKGYKHISELVAHKLPGYTM